MRVPMGRFFAGLALAVAASAGLEAAASFDWPRYRGPDGDGVSRETGGFVRQAFP